MIDVKLTDRIIAELKFANYGPCGCEESTILRLLVDAYVDTVKDAIERATHDLKLIIEYDALVRTLMDARIDTSHLTEVRYVVDLTDQAASGDVPFALSGLQGE